MRTILTIAAVIICLSAVFLAGRFNGSESDPLDPRSPPTGIEPGEYSHQTTKTETWSNVPIAPGVDGGTEAASFERQSSTTENTEEKLRAMEPVPGALGLLRGDTASRSSPNCDANCPQRAPVPFSPPAPAHIGERVPHWSEHPEQGQYREDDWPGPEGEERPGLFARLRERRAGR